MSQQHSTVLNGPSGELTMAFKDAQQLHGMVRDNESVLSGRCSV